MADFCGELTFPSQGFRLGWCSVPALAGQAVLALDADPVAAHLLGRSLAALLASGLGGPGRCQARWQYRGRLQEIALVLEEGTVAATIEPPHLVDLVSSLEELFGDGGTLALILDGKGHRGEVHLLDPPGDLAYFESLVRQTECGVCAAISLRADPQAPVAECRAVWLQALPETDLAAFEVIRQRLEAPEFLAFLLGLAPDGDFGPRCVRQLVGEAVSAADLASSRQERIVPTLRV